MISSSPCVESAKICYLLVKDPVALSVTRSELPLSLSRRKLRAAGETSFVAKAHVRRNIPCIYKRQHRLDEKPGRSPLLGATSRREYNRPIPSHSPYSRALMHNPLSGASIKSTPIRNVRLPHFFRSPSFSSHRSWSCWCYPGTSSRT